MTSRYHDYRFQVLNKERGCYCSAVLASYIVSEADCFTFEHAADTNYHPVDVCQLCDKIG